MPATRTTRRSSTGAAARARHEDHAHTIERISRALEAAQKDLTSLRGNLGTGMGDLRRDVARLLKDARRDVGAMSKAVRRDLERLQRDIVTPPSPRRRGSAAKRPSKPRARRGGA
jgi:ABC-type transporter Mla subunit MlaD